MAALQQLTPPAATTVAGTAFVVAPPIPAVAPPLSLLSSASSSSVIPAQQQQQQQQGVGSPLAMRRMTMATPTSASSSPLGPAPLPPPLALPTSFSSKAGAELVEGVRTSAGVTHRKAQVAVNSVLQFLKKEAPQCEGMVDALLAALEQAMVCMYVCQPQRRTEGSPPSIRKITP